MRKLINSTYITIDGVVEGPHLWPVGGRPSDERSGQIQSHLLLSCDAVLMGRRTYDGFAPVWPTRSGDPYSDRINTMPKYVVSTTLEAPEWANTHAHRRQTSSSGSRSSSTRPARTSCSTDTGPSRGCCSQHDLLDELRLWVHPLILGTGSPSDLLFGEAPATHFELIDATPLSDGNVILSYATRRQIASE